MQSRWFNLKDAAIALRQNGQSIKTINRNLGVPISTLSGWLKNVELTEQHKVQLQENRDNGLINARLKAVEWHRTQKILRMLQAKHQAENTLDRIELSNEVLDLAFAMLYLGEGSKSGTTSISSSNPTILKFVLAVLKRNYGIKYENIHCDLHLRMDQDPDTLKKYWSDELSIPLGCFKYVVLDKRSKDKATYGHYKGVCVLNCGNIAIQRKLMYLYNLFCEKIIQLDSGT